MVIDKTTKTDDAKNTSFYQDQHVSTIVNTQLVSDDACKIVADNIALIKQLSSKLPELITLTKEFNDYSEKFLADDYDGNTGLQVLDESSKKFTDELIGKLNTLSMLEDEIANLGSISDAITKLAEVKDTLIEINGNMVNFEKIVPISADINIVAAMDEVIKKTILFEAELKALNDAMGELLTIYNYLPQLLQTAEWVKKYLTLQQTEGFSDKEFYDNIVTVVENIESLKNITANIDSLKALQEAITNAPDIVAEVEAKLKDLSTRYSVQLSDQYKKHEVDLKHTVNDIKMQLADKLLELGKIINDLKEYPEIDMNAILFEIKEGRNITIDRGQGEITINAEALEVDKDDILWGVKAGNHVAIRREQGSITIDVEDITVPEVDLDKMLWNIKAGKYIDIERENGQLTINGAEKGDKVEAGDNIFIDIEKCCKHEECCCADRHRISTYSLKAGKDITLETNEREITIAVNGNVTPDLPINGIDEFVEALNG